jgi:hypothetical protein
VVFNVKNRDVKRLCSDARVVEGFDYLCGKVWVAVMIECLQYRSPHSVLVSLSVLIGPSMAKALLP